MSINLINSSQKRRKRILDNIKRRILKEVYKSNKAEQDTPEKAYDRAMKGI